MFCEKCGKELKIGDAFCWSCGTPVPDATDMEEEAEKVLSESVTAIQADNEKTGDMPTNDTTTNVSQENTSQADVTKTTATDNTSVNSTSTNQATSYNNSNKIELDSRLLSGKVSRKFNYHNETNGVASALRLIGWLVIGLGTLAGFIIIFYALSKTGSSSGSYSSLNSAVAGVSTGLGIGVIVASIIPGLGFLGFAEIIQLLQDQKTILLRQTLRNDEKQL